MVWLGEIERKLAKLSKTTVLLLAVLSLNYFMIEQLPLYLPLCVQCSTNIVNTFVSFALVPCGLNSRLLSILRNADNLPIAVPVYSRQRCWKTLLGIFVTCRWRWSQNSWDTASGYFLFLVFFSWPGPQRPKPSGDSLHLFQKIQKNSIFICQ